MVGSACQAALPGNMQILRDVSFVTISAGLMVVVDPDQTSVLAAVMSMPVGFALVNVLMVL